MRSQTLVRDVKSKRVGVVIDDHYSTCEEGEVAVVFAGTNFFTTMPVTTLEELGEENARPDVKKCGAGAGSDCCIFLVVGSVGPVCMRFGSLRDHIILRSHGGQMNAHREPTEMFPDCMLKR